PRQSTGDQGTTSGSHVAAENGETPLSSMPRQSTGDQGTTSGSHAAAGHGSTPLAPMPAQSNGSQGASGGRTAAGYGSTPLAPMPAQSNGSQGASGGRTAAGHGSTSFTPMPAQSINGISHSMGGNISSVNGGAILSPMAAQSGVSNSRVLGSSNTISGSRTLPTNSSPVTYGNSGRFDYTPRVSGPVNSKPIIMPKHVQTASAKLKDHMVRRPTTKLTAKDTMVSKYADLAQKVYDSTTVSNARKAYDVAKNTVTGGYKGEDK
ncbi:hypothetical protein P4U97_01070, partial [Bacillus swezeyi]|nr:hypothetical protein [Bacillus swezeyi]